LSRSPAKVYRRLSPFRDLLNRPFNGAAYVGVEQGKRLRAAMLTMPLSLRRLVQTSAQFCHDRRANTAITFAIAVIPLMAFIGSAVDYSRASSVKVELQSALDATALMVSKSAASMTATQLNSTANNYFLAQFSEPSATNVAFNAAYSTSGGSNVVVTGSADLPTQFLGIIGITKISLSGSSTAKWGSTRLRVALVLDTTGSMNDDGKIDALKTATKNMLTQLQASASTDGDVYVSIIPFSKNVNVDPANYNANWIDWTDWEAEPAVLDTTKGGSKPSNWKQVGPGSSCPFSNNSHGFGCVSTATSTTSVSNIPSSGSAKGYICPGTDSGRANSTKIGIMYNGCYDSNLYDCTGSSCSCSSWSNCSCSGSGSSKHCKSTSDYVHVWRPSGTNAAPSHSTWNGCVTERGSTSAPVSDYDRLTTAPSTSIQASLFPAEQNSYCSPTIMGLSYSWSSMSTLVDSLYPLGATNQPIGLVWGWQSLVGGGPLTMPAKDPNYTYSDVIILLTDGLNTLDRWYGNGSSTSTSVDTRMYDSSGLGTCKNIKDSGVTIYAVQVNTGGDPTSTLLQNCASDSSKFFLLTSATQIITTFQAIGTNLTKLRIAQ
jgi:Flp pilus assembly protein TadG